MFKQGLICGLWDSDVVCDIVHHNPIWEAAPLPPGMSPPILAPCSGSGGGDVL